MPSGDLRDDDLRDDALQEEAKYENAQSFGYTVLPYQVGFYESLDSCLVKEFMSLLVCGGISDGWFDIPMLSQSCSHGS